jgi:hypothetical protein
MELADVPSRARAYSHRSLRSRLSNSFRAATVGSGCRGLHGIHTSRPVEESPPPLEWYAVYTRARHGKAVARALERRGLPTLLPLYRALHVWKDRRRQVELPLFP